MYTFHQPPHRTQLPYASGAVAELRLSIGMGVKSWRQ
jgi:hypothetical protein